MLGDLSAAEDIAQETWLRWANADHSSIENPAAWLLKVATNLSIDTLKSARRKRETYVGPWLPEPILPDESNAQGHFELAQECRLALMWAMDRLTENERAAFIMREAFDAGYGEISQTLGKSEVACRQLVARAHKHLQSSGPRFDSTEDEVQELIAKFFSAVAAQDHQSALELFAPDAIGITDGGRKVRAARRVLNGRDEILQVLFSVWEKTRRDTDWSTELRIINQSPALIYKVKNKTDSVMTLAPNELGKITWFYMMRNPDKLRFSNG
jgi:RNA polymerase sigma-70 factor (ECF subfamily)